jgi:hypothetical protein
VCRIEVVRAGEVGEHLGVPPGASLARRTYTITIAHLTIGALTEWLVPGRLAALAVPLDTAVVASSDRSSFGAWPIRPPASVWSCLSPIS